MVGNVTTLLHEQAPDGLFTPVLSVLLRYASSGTTLNQNKAVANGAITAAKSVLASNATGWSQSEAILLLTALMRGNSDAKDAALKEGQDLQHVPSL